MDESGVKVGKSGQGHFPQHSSRDLVYVARRVSCSGRRAKITGWG